MKHLVLFTSGPQVYIEILKKEVALKHGSETKLYIDYMFYQNKKIKNNPLSFNNYMYEKIYKYYSIKYNLLRCDDKNNDASWFFLQKIYKKNIKSLIISASGSINELKETLDNTQLDYETKEEIRQYREFKLLFFKGSTIPTKLRNFLIRPQDAKLLHDNPNAARASSKHTRSRFFKMALSQAIPNDKVSNITLDYLKLKINSHLFNKI